MLVSAAATPLQSLLVSKMKLLLLLFTSTCWLTGLTVLPTDIEDEGWPRRPVEDGLLVQLYNVENDCLLVMRDSEKVPGDPQQPQQVTVGCSPAPMSEPEEPRYLWQVGESLLQDGNYNPEDERVVRNGTKLVLTNWEWLRYLSTENLQGHSQSKTAGDLSQRRKWELILEEAWWYQDLQFKLFQALSGQFLAVTERQVVTTEVEGGTSWRVVFSRPPRQIEYMTEREVEELYHGGTSEKTLEARAVLSHPQSSTADLARLQTREILLLEKVQKYGDCSVKILTETLAEDGYSLDSVLNTDVLNPVDSYNLVKRTSRTWPRILRKLQEKQQGGQLSEELELVSKYFPVWNSSRKAVGLGLYNLAKYYELSAADLVEGRLKDERRNITYQAATRLTPGDLGLIARLAEEEKDLRSATAWLAQSPRLRKRYRKLVRLHDDLLNYEAEEAVERGWVLSDQPLAISGLEQSRFRNIFSEKRKLCPPFVTADPEEEELSTRDCLTYFYSAEISRLCRGDRKVRPPEKDVTAKCEFLHFYQADLRLGPFKYEVVNDVGNFVGMIHGFMSEKEVEEMKDKARGEMKATPYIDNNRLKDFSYERTSKIKYISERVDHLASAVSRRLERAVRLRVFWPGYRFTSENYQVMNYGLAGHISLHMDAAGTGQDGVLHGDNEIAGGRIATAMIYLSHVQSGGFTIFPKIGLFVKPEPGKLLFWILKRTDGSLDDRMFHLGCPVLYGDKWISTKWIRWEPQMFRFKCFLPRGRNFLPYSNGQGQYFEEN